MGNEVGLLASSGQKMALFLHIDLKSFSSKFEYMIYIF